jgi:hypothetical protein
MFTPRFPYVGETHVDVGLFSRASGDRLPLAGASVGQRSYRVATFNLELAGDTVFIVFRDGWHETEAGDQGGVEWQWSRREGTLSFRNPKRDATFYLELDQPVHPFDSPQHVELRLGPDVVDRFDLPAGQKMLRRVTLTAAQLGEADTADVTLSVDRSFIPSAIPELKSTDPRELGVRVFRAFVQPS